MASPFPTPNYIDPETRVSMILGVEISFITITTVVVVSRLISPSFTNKRKLGWDDWCMALALVLAIVVSVLNCVSTKTGFGYHLWDFKSEWIAPTGKYALIQQVLFGPTVTLTKISILLFYKRIFPEKLMIALIWVGIGFELLYCVTITFGALFQCIPIKAYWVPTTPGKKCIKQYEFLVALAVVNTLSDLYVFILPMFSFSKLQMPRKQKLGIMFVFGLGLIVCVAGIVRIWFSTVFFNSRDPLYDGALLSVIAVIETNVGIIGGSLPSIRPLISKIFPRLLNSTGKHTGYANEGNSFPFQNLYAKDTYGTQVSSTARNNFIDNESEEHIVGPNEGPLTINHTVDFTVESRPRGMSKDRNSKV